MIHELFVASLLQFTQSVATNIKGCNALSELILIQTARQNFIIQSVEHQLNFSQILDLNKDIQLDVVHTLSFTQQVSPFTLIASAESYFFIWGHSSQYTDNQPRSTLNLTQSAECTVSKGAKSQLVFTQEATVVVDNVAQVSQQFIISQAVSVYKVPRLGDLLN